MPGDCVLDPFAGTGTTLCVASGLNRRSIGIEKSTRNVAAIVRRLADCRPEDDVNQYRDDYAHTPGLSEVWDHGGVSEDSGLAKANRQSALTMPLAARANHIVDLTSIIRPAASA